MKYIFLTGRATLQTLTLIFKEIFHSTNFEAKNFKFKHQLSNQLTVFVDCELEKIDFNLTEYKEQINEFRKNLKAIICLDTLNPRPEKLVNIVQIIKSVFDLNELKTKTHFLFSFSSDRTLSLETFRKDAMHFNIIYKDFQIAEYERKRFVDKKIWLLDPDHFEALITVLKLKNKIGFKTTCIFLLLAIAFAFGVLIYIHCFNLTTMDSNKCSMFDLASNLTYLNEIKLLNQRQIIQSFQRFKSSAIIWMIEFLIDESLKKKISELKNEKKILK